LSDKNNLVSIESQSEYSITTGKKETRIFVKMYVEAVHSGLIANMGPERWQNVMRNRSVHGRKRRMLPDAICDS
jgi:hypothetical protein